MTQDTFEGIPFERRAQAAERTVEVLKAKVLELYNGGPNTAVHRQLERARQREEENRRRREVMEAKTEELERYSAVLEHQVAERTREIQEILDHVDFGFLIIDADLTVRPGVTQSCSTLLGTDEIVGRDFRDVLGVEDDDTRFQLEIGVEQIFDDIFPEEVSVAQLPQRFFIGGRALRVVGSVIREGGDVARVLMTISDITAQEAAERESRTNRSLIRILKQIESFKSFLADTRAKLEYAREAVDRGDQVYVRRVVHTIKGNAGSYGLEDVAHTAHVVEGEEVIGHAGLDEIAKEFRVFLGEHEEVLGIDFDAEEADVYEVTGEAVRELEAITYDFEPERDGPALERWVSRVTMKPASQLLGPVENFVVRLAERLEKDVRFELEGAQTLVNVERMRPVFLNLTHLLRNSLDHGLEPSWERAGKAPIGSLTVCIAEDSGGHRIEVRDDGRGIDTETLVARALERGYVKPDTVGRMSHAERQALIFTDGLSCARQATEISGRGVGMSAVRSEVERVHGSIEVRSEPGFGTTVAIVIPKDEGPKDVSAAE